MTDSNISALIEAIIYLAEEPVRLEQIARALGDVPEEKISSELESLKQRYAEPDRGIEIREVAGGYRFATKPEHHEVLTRFAKSMVPPTRLSLAALETLAVIAYRQPVTVPEIQEIRGVHASGVIKTLLDRRLVTAAGRKDVIGRPILYKTTRQFLLHFGLKSLDELPSMEEFEELIKSEHAEGAAEAELPAELPFEDPPSNGPGDDPGAGSVTVEDGTEGTEGPVAETEPVDSEGGVEGERDEERDEEPAPGSNPAPDPGTQQEASRGSPDRSTN
jgi:segregation and condensation protein B